MNRIPKPGTQTVGNASGYREAGHVLPSTDVSDRIPMPPVKSVALSDLTLSDLATLIEQVYRSLANMGSEQKAVEERPQPAVPVKKSVTPDYIVCLEDGKKLKMLKRHLKTAYNMTPEEYRERWGLPADYPMVAPNYAHQRSSLAKQIGLGIRSRRNRTG